VCLSVLRIKLTMPSAHFKVIHSSSPRKTYPLPPYSTVIGFLANIIGNTEKIQEMLHGTLALGILSQYGYLSKEYTWLRNLSYEQHTGRYVSANNRELQGIAEHPGGQSPVSIEVLNEVGIWLYIYHSDPGILTLLKQNYCLPEKWFNHLHLGRSEDWAVIESIDLIEMQRSNQAGGIKNTNQYFQWMPRPDFAFGISQYINERDYTELYNKIQGPATLVTSVYELTEAPLGSGKTGTIRSFRHIPARLTCSSIPFLDTFILPGLLTDREVGSSVYMGLINNQ